MRISTFALSLLFGLTAISSLRAEVYELRTYTTNEGKLDDLHARFRDHTMKLFEKHGIENIGYWVPTDERAKDTLVYVIKHKDRDAAKASWAAFMKDEEWKAAYKASIAKGRLVKKVDSVYMNATDFYPDYASSKGLPKEVFELREYTTQDGKLDNLKQEMERTKI